ncbi:unnamed protein product, partial [Nesidiocoris tenuis]
ALFWRDYSENDETARVTNIPDLNLRFRWLWTIIGDRLEPLGHTGPPHHP